MEAFHNFIDNFEMVHEDVVLRLFSKSLVRDAALWFKNMEDGSIGSLDDLYNTFSISWGENKSLDQYLTDFHTLRRGKEEALVVFNKRFYTVYYSMPLEIRPNEIAALAYYVIAQQSNLVLFLLERKSSSLRQLFEYAKGVEENIRASKRIQYPVYCEDLHREEQEDCQYVSYF